MSSYSDYKWRAVDTYPRDADQPVKRPGRVVLEQNVETGELREQVVGDAIEQSKEAVGDNDE